MRNIFLVAGVLGVVGFSACSSSHHAGAIGDSPGSSGKLNPGGGKSSIAQGGNGGEAAGAGGAADAGATSKPQPGDGGAGGAGGGESGPPPIVTILTPGPVTDPLGGAVLVSDGVDVTCKVVPSKDPGAQAVDPQSVKISVVGPDDTVIAEKPALLTATATEYAANVPLTGVTTGKIALRCNAASLTRAIGSASIDTLADRGPIITLTQPAPDSPLALKVPAKFTFTALPQPIAKGDTQAEVASVTMTINGIEFTPTPKSAGAYEATVDLNGPKFLTKPNGMTTFTVSAKNKRAPEAAVGQAMENVNVDGTGPVITVTSPASSDIIGGIVTVAFTATDTLSGVDPDSIFLSIADDAHKHKFNDVPTDWTHVGDTFTYKFDSAKLFDSKWVQLPIVVTANDNVGNAGFSETVPLYLDNAGPQLDLDPMNIRTSDVNKVCSSSFDPVGGSVPDDLEPGSGLDVFRLMVWDKTNVNPVSPAVRFLSGADPASVQLFVRAWDDSKKLLVNTVAPGTGVCNDVQDSGVPTESVKLTMLAPTGGPVGSPDTTTLPAAACDMFLPPSPPQKLCGGTSDMWDVIRHRESQLNEGAIYVFSPNVDACTGQGWNYGANHAEGWVCLAARAKDKKGNIGVSPPIRLCYDDPNSDTHPGCITAPNSNPPPSCTDGCTPPARGGGFVLIQN